MGRPALAHVDDTPVVSALPSGPDAGLEVYLQDAAMVTQGRMVLKRYNGTGWETVSVIPTGGTTGQALVKASATDLDVSWGSAGHTVADEGIPKPSRPTLDFAGSGVSVSDDVSNAKTIVTIPGGGGGGSALGGAQYTTTIGDAVARTFTVTHALGTRNVQVAVYQTASPYQDVTGGLEYEHASVDQVIIRTSAALPALATGEYTVVVSGPGALETKLTRMSEPVSILCA